VFSHLFTFTQLREVNGFCRHRREVVNDIGVVVSVHVAVAVSVKCKGIVVR